MALRRLPKHLTGIDSQTEGDLIFPDRVDLRGGDTVVFDDGVIGTINGVSILANGGTKAVFGNDPACAPRPHSGGPVPKFEDDGVTPFGEGT